MERSLSQPRPSGWSGDPVNKSITVIICLLTVYLNWINRLDSVCKIINTDCTVTSLNYYLVIYFLLFLFVLLCIVGLNLLLDCFFIYSVCDN